MKTLSALIEMLVRWNGFLRKKWNWNDEQPFTAWSIKVNPVHRVFIEVWYGSVPYVTVDGETVEWAVHLALRALVARRVREARGAGRDTGCGIRDAGSGMRDSGSAMREAGFEVEGAPCWPAA